MAKRLNYQIGITADTSQFQAQMNRIFEQLNSLSNQNSLVPSIQKASLATAELSQNLSKAVNISTGKLDLTAFIGQLDKSGHDLTYYYTELSKLGPQGQETFAQLARSITQAEMPLKRTSKLMSDLWITMKNTVRWQITSSALQGFTGALQTAYGYSKSLDASLNNIRIVSDKSADDMKEFAEYANKAAKALSTTTTDYTDASLIYYQQGLSDKEVLERTDTTIKMANVAGQTAETVSDQMTAVWNNFYDGSKSIEYYADVMVKLGAATASSTDEIAEGLEKFAAVGNTVGLSYEYATAALATITSNTRQSAEVVGTALKTIFARIQGLTLGETLEDGVDLNKYSKALEAVGINVLDANGELIKMDDLLDQLGEKWNTISNAQQVALAQTVAGVRQYNQLTSLMENWDVGDADSMQANLKYAQEAEGELQRQADIYAESWEAARNRVTAAAEDIYDSLINPDFYIGVDNALTPILTGLAKLIDGAGGLNGVLSASALLMNKVYGKQIAQSMRDLAANIGVLKNSDQQRAVSLKDQAFNLQKMLNFEDDSLKNQAEWVALQQEISDMSTELSEPRKAILQNDLEHIQNLQTIINLRREEINTINSNLNASEQTAGMHLDDRLGFEHADDNIIGMSLEQNTNEAMDFADALLWILRDANDIGDAFDSLTQQFKILIEERTRLSAVRNELTKLQQEFDEARKQAQDPTTVNIEVPDELIHMLQEVGLYANQSEEDVKALFAANPDELTNALNQVEGNLASVRAGIDLTRTGLIGLGDGTRAYTNAINNMETNTARAVIATDGLNTTVNVQGEVLRKTGERIKEYQKNLYDWADIIVKVGSTLSTISMGVNAINSLADTFESLGSDGVTGGEAFLRVLSSLAMLLPTVGNLLGAVKIANAKNAVQFIMTGAAAGTGAAGIASFSMAINALLPVVAVAAVAIYAIVKVISAIIVTEEEAKEKIQEATDAYEEQKSALESLNDELKTAKERIEELNGQDTLTIVEQEELEKLKQQEASLERQVQLQEQLTKAAQKTQATEIEENYSKSNKSLVGGPDLRQYMSWNQDNSSEDWYKEALVNMPDDFARADFKNNNRYTYHEEYVDADTWFESVTRGLDKTSDAYRDYLVTYQQWVADNEQATAEWITNNAEAIQAAEDNYAAYIDAVVNGAIDKDSDQIADMQAILSGVRQNVYGSQGAYQEAIIKPILDVQAVSQVSTQLYNALANGDIEDGAAFISSSIQNELMLAGVSVDEFLDYVNNRVDSTKADIQEKFGDTFDFDSLTGDEWDILMDINLDNFDSVEELQEFLDDYETNDINVNVTGIEDLKELLDTLNESQTALEKALKSYKEQDGYLTMDQVQDLIDADESYAQYIVKVGDAYKLTNASLQALLDSERQEEQILDASIEAAKAKYEVNKDYVQNYSSMWDELATKASDWESYTFVDEADANRFIARTEALKKNAQAYQDGSISAAEYFDTINNRLGLINAGFHRLNEEIEDDIDETDLYEETLVAAAGSIADGLTDLNKQFKSGSINMDEYYEGTIAGTKALITAQSKLNKNIKKNTDGTWELKEGVDQTTLSSEEYQQAMTDIANLNSWETQVANAESMTGVVQSLTDNYDYLLQYADSFGAIDFTIDNNFDTTAQEFQNMCSSVGEQLIGLEQTNEESYKRILAGIEAQGIELANGLDTSATELMEAMSTDTNIAGAVLNSTMSESAGTITSVSQAAGGVLSALGDLISNFDYDLGFTPYVKSWGKLQIADWINGKATLPFELPTLGMKITGEGGEGVSNFVNALSEAGSYLSSQGTGTGQGGIFDYGQEPLGYDPNATLNPDDIESDNIRNGGSSSGKTLDKEDLKTLDEVEDRYHNINRQLERQSDLLDDIDNATDRAYGKDKLAKFEEGIKALEKEQELLNKKLGEAKDVYLPQDIAAVKQYFSNAQIDSNGEITNYEELLRLNMEMYNAEVEKYNLAVAGKTLTEEESEALKAQLETAKTLYDIRLAALEQYESTLDTIRDVTDKIEENARSIADQKLEEIKYKLEIVLDVKSMYDSLRDLEKEIAESFGDALTHGLQSAKLSAEAAQAEAALLPDYRSEYEELKALYESADDADRQAIMEEIQDLQGKVIDSASALVEWANSIEDIVPDAVDAAAERFAAFTDQLDHNTSVLDTIKELYALQGVTYKTMDGFNRLQKVSQEKLEAQVASAVLQKSWYEEAEARLAEAQAKLDSLNGDETDIRYDAYKKARDAYLEEFNEAQEAYLSSAKEAMETAQEMYTQQIEKAVYEFGQAISNGIGLDLLQEQYDHYIEESERYLDTVNEAYQVASWYNKLQKDIDESTNSVQAQRLKDLQKEIDIRRENNTLSEYDLEILEAKYNVLQAQMALEDAQNAKNNLQLVRDSQGNWNYQYTADQDKIADAEQGLLDAQNDWYNIAKQQVTDITGEIVTMWKECQDKVKEIYTDDNLTYEEKLAAAEEVQKYYSEKAKYLEEEKNIAIKDMNEAGSEALIGIAQTTGEETADLIGEFTNTYADKLGEMTQTNADFEDRLNELLDLAEQDFLDYQDTVDNVAEETGTTLDDLAEETDKVSDATDILWERGLDAADALWNQIDAAQNASDSYLDLADSIWEAVYAMQALAAEQADYTASQAGASSGSSSSKNYDAGTDYSGVIMDGIANGWLQYGSNAYNELFEQRENKIDGEGLSEDYYISRGDEADDRFSGAGSVNQYDSEEEWRDKLHNLGISGFATGGYTGTFDDAKLAFLHEKELVLNQEDTANILAAVHAVRDFGPNLLESIEKALDNNTVAAMALMGAKLTTSMVAPQSDVLEQTVHIDKVEFPNVTSRTEIEEAFISLTNDAAQWARRRT